MKTGFRVGAVVACLLAAPTVLADSVEYINTHTQQALSVLRQSTDGAGEVLDHAAGVLVFPDIFKLGFGAGGQYGEGVLLVQGQPVAYYSTAGDNYGQLPGARFKSEVIVFRTQEALQQFRNRHGWQVGVDGKVSLARPDPGHGLNFAGGDDSTVGFIFSNQGLVADLTMEGAHITRLAR